jgi:threonine/homoserine/homoserine lactone efflux protein
VSGLILGTMAVLLAVALGVAAFVQSIPQGARALGVLSAAYIVFLAFRIATAPPLETRNRRAADPAFAGGFLLAIANPKAYLAIAATFASATLFAEDHALDAVVKAMLLGAMIVVIHMGWLLAGASLSRLLQDPVRSRLINVSLAAALVTATLAALLS